MSRSRHTRVSGSSKWPSSAVPTTLCPRLSPLWPPLLRSRNLRVFKWNIVLNMCLSSTSNHTNSVPAYLAVYNVGIMHALMASRTAISIAIHAENAGGGSSTGPSRRLLRRPSLLPRQHQASTPTSSSSASRASASSSATIRPFSIICHCHCHLLRLHQVPCRYLLMGLSH